jgi:hypothetical protein
VGTSLHRTLAIGQQSLDLSMIRYHDVAKTDVLTASSMKIQVIKNAPRRPIKTDVPEILFLSGLMEDY